MSRPPRRAGCTANADAVGEGLPGGAGQEQGRPLPDGARSGAEIERWLADEPVLAWQEPWTVKARRWVNRRRTLVTGTAAALAVGVIGLAAATALLTAEQQKVNQANSDLIVASARVHKTNEQLTQEQHRVKKQDSELEAGRAALAQTVKQLEASEIQLKRSVKELQAANDKTAEALDCNKLALVAGPLERGAGSSCQRFA